MEKERKLQIIKTAEKRFVKHGYHKTTLDEVARDLRISKSTLYHYFTSKENLYFSTLRYQIDQYLVKVKEIFIQEIPSVDKINQYLTFKEIVFDSYKLILTLFIHFMNETNFEEEIEILKELYLKEEECLKPELSRYNFKKEEFNFTFSSLMVHHSWGIILNTRIAGKSLNGALQKNFELIKYLIATAEK